MHRFPRMLGLVAVLAAVPGAAVWAADEKPAEKPAGPTPRMTELVRKAGGTLSYALPGYPVFQTAEGRKQLGLTAQQQEKIVEIGSEYNYKIVEQQKLRSSDWAMRDVKPEDRWKVERDVRERDRKRADEARKWADDARKQVEQLLDARQLAKLKDLEFRQRIPTIYYTPQLLDQLGLDEEQKKKISAIYKENSSKREEANRKMAELSREMYQAQLDASNKMIETLRPEQVEKLKDLSLKPVPYIIPAPSKLDK